MAKVFITGSSDGLGLMAARILIQQGHQVVLHGRNPERAEAALGAAPGAAPRALRLLTQALPQASPRRSFPVTSSSHKRPWRGF